MLLQRALFVWTMAATALPVVAAHPAEATPAAPAPAVESWLPSPVPQRVFSVPMDVLRFDSKPGDLTYQAGVAAAVPPSDEIRFDFALHPVPETSFWLSPAASTLRTGWSVSGRMGPLNWFTPVKGDAELAMRLWGRVPGQPSLPGMGNFNISLHYTFE